jgi:transcriptional regulator of acetoin/glycerol metabolism
LAHLNNLHAKQPSEAEDLESNAGSIEALTKTSLINALDACQGNRRRAAKRLKVSLRTIYNMINRYGLPKKQPRKTSSK